MNYSSGRPLSSTQWSTASTRLSKLKLKLQSQTHGLTSEQLSKVQDRQAKANGGDMSACINYDYERDYILEAIMNDKMLQAKKSRKKSFDLRRTTKAQEGIISEAKKRIERIKEKEMSDNQTTVKRAAPPLAMPQYLDKPLGNENS